MRISQAVLTTCALVSTTLWCSVGQGKGPSGGTSAVGPVLGTAFTWRDRVSINASPMTCMYEFQCSLWDAATGGNQIGPTITVNNVTVVAGDYSVQLDFG